MNLPVIVAVDIETTGLQSDSESIIEVAAVKFRGREVLGTFHSLVNPGKHLPYRITRLTGINSRDLIGAPKIDEIAGNLAKFIDSYPLLGHSVAFDANFLRKHNIALKNELIDTFEMASIILPNLSSYTLESVATSLKINGGYYHRALADATLAKDVFLSLLKKLEGFSETTLSDITKAGWLKGWPLAKYFSINTSVNHERNLGIAKQLGVKLGINPKVLTLPIASGDFREGHIVENPIVNGHLLPDISTYNGPVDKTFEDHSIAIIETDNSVNEARHHIESAVSWANRTRRKLIISFGIDSVGKTLSEKTLPEIQAGLGTNLKTYLKFPYENYICTHRWFGSARWSSISEDSEPGLARGMLKFALWLEKTKTGGRHELNLMPPETEDWERVAAADLILHEDIKCAYKDQGFCYAHASLEQAGNADIVLVPHNLLLNSKEMNKIAGDEYDLLVVEAHLLEINASKQNHMIITQKSLQQILRRYDLIVGGSFNKHLRDLLMNNNDNQKNLQDITRKIRSNLNDSDSQIRKLFEKLTEIIINHSGSNSESEQWNTVTVLNNRIRGTDTWESIKINWESSKQIFEDTLEVLKEAVDILRKYDQKDEDGASRGPIFALELELALLEIRKLYLDINEILEQDDHDMLCWLDTRKSIAYVPDKKQYLNSVDSKPPVPILHSAKTIDIDSIKELFNRRNGGTVLASSAISVDHSFEFAYESLGLNDSVIQTYPSTNSRENQTLLCMPDDIEEPGQPSYQNSLCDLIIRTSANIQGYMVVLFASHAALRNTYSSVKNRLESQKILLLAQGIDGSPRQLWMQSRSQNKLVIFGVIGFSDLLERSTAGPDCVIIARMPLPALSDPVVAIRANRFSDQLHQFVVPSAAIRMKRTMNFMLWNTNKRNAVVLFDPRLIQKEYGEVILHSLPKCTERIISSQHLPEEISSWLQQESK